jgi:uncharacterized protein (UPF0332 family)
LRKQNIRYRIKRARETYEDAVYLFEKGSFNSSMNRLYYAAFYATIALLLDRDIEVKSHIGVKQKLGEEFVVTGILSKDHARTLSILSDYRHKGDYDDLFDFDKEIVERLLIPTKQYIDKIEEILNT